jgi:precorrin-2 dehydrogenase/sirohydrochlorin ferrochelatase
MHLPFSLDVAGRPVRVVGDSERAAHKAGILIDAGADVSRVSPSAYHRGDAGRYWLVVTAAEPAENAIVFEDAEAAGVWCNAVDDPEHCSVLFPAVVRRGPVTVAVSTGGSSPALASWLRRELEGVVGPELADVALRLAEERRRIHAAGGSTEGIDWVARIETHLDDVRARRF